MIVPTVLFYLNTFDADSIDMISDIDGNFTLTVSSGNVTFMVSFIGMKV